MAAHMTRHFHPLHPFNPDNFIFSNGVTALCEMLGFSLFDEGDAVLLSRPMYQAFRGDFGTKARFALPIYQHSLCNRLILKFTYVY